MIGRTTIPDGTRVAVWDSAGRVRFVDGPRRIWLWRKQVHPLRRFSAEVDEYLAIRHRDGRATHLRGPAEVWLHPVEHESIEVRPLTPLDANEAVVIYRRDAEGGVARRVLRGPAQYMPEPEEWLHEFVWHGADKLHPRVKAPGALRFYKLRVIPDQTYFDVRDVRTADDALITVQVMIFFELADIERMLNQTHDPIADFINAVSADVIDFAATRSFEGFKRETEALNELASYPNLTGRAERIGYRIGKVVYRGYEANARLQEMHDQAIAARTALQLEAETERQAQELADLKLGREAERAEQKRRIERADVAHAQQMRELAHAQQLREREAAHARKVAARRDLDALSLERIRGRNGERTALLRAMRDLQVDVTRYLVAQYRHPDRLIRIDNESRGTLHLHERLEEVQ